MFSLHSANEDSDARFLATLASRLILVHASHFSRRLTEVLGRFPYKILLLLKTSPACVCEARMKLATEILDTPLSQLHIVGRKLKDLYREDLEYAKRTGKLTTWLYYALSEVSNIWRSDTRESERATEVALQ